MVTVEDVRRFALTLPRTTEHLVRDRIKFRVGRIVYLAFARDELSMGFGFPKDERASLVEQNPGKFFLPSAGDLRYHWVRVWLSELDEDEMRELVTDAWCMCVSKKTREQYFASLSGVDEN
ncbi:MAG TPA: MmcQ/YjbR family DNA-binding protein [Micromonosporaceae bacterium]